MPFQPADYGAYGDQSVTALDRRLVANLLRAARADQRLSDADLADRLRRTGQAGAFDDLVRLTQDLMY